MKSAAVLSIEGVSHQTVDLYLQEAKNLIDKHNASVMVFFMLTDYFTVHDKKHAINFLLDSVRAQGLATILILSPMFTVQDLSGLKADSVQYVNFHLWRAYNEIINKKQSPANPAWNLKSNQFLFLTGKPDRPHRVRLLWKFRQCNLLDQCCWSFWYNSDNITPLQQLLPEVPESELNQVLDSLLRNPDNINMQRVGKSFHYCGMPYDVSLFANSRFRVISESVFSNNKPRPPFNYWLGEKTYITLLNRLPWIMAAEPGSLQWLKNQGFETFEQALVQPYDEINDQEQRLDAVVANTQAWLTDMPEVAKINQQVEHNYQQAVILAQQYEKVLYNVIAEFNLSATPEQLVPTIDK